MLGTEIKMPALKLNNRSDLGEEDSGKRSLPYGLETAAGAPSTHMGVANHNSAVNGYFESSVISLPETAPFRPSKSREQEHSGDDDRTQLGRGHLKLTDEQYRKLRNEKPAD
jgi:hypothetical protein